MPTAWNGGDPLDVVDSEDYELGIAYRAEADITVTHARIYTPAGEETIAPRRYRHWSAVGGLLYTETLPDDLPSGWYLHELTTPQEVTSGTVFIPSYNTGGNYGALANALDADVVSADGNVTALGASNAPGGHNGRFNETPGSFPNSGAGSHPFYGVDFQYTVGIGGNTAPRITDTSAVANQLQVIAAAVVEDDESLTGLTLRIEWGDGASSDVVYPTLSASHTYAAAGVYPLLFRATDSDGAVDYAADYVITTSPDPTVFTLDIPGLQAAICGTAQRVGHFPTVDGHEPREAPNNDLHAAFWLLSIRPAGGRVSGLASTATVVTFLGRLYIPAGDGVGEPADQLDVDLLAAVDRLMAAFIGDFTLGGRVRNVDIFGEVSPGLSADAGYVAFGGPNGKKFRVMTITLPLIVNDMYEEVP
jgi:hypothetical protein